MAALIQRNFEAHGERDEIPTGTLYLLILKTLAVGGRIHGYEIADHIQISSEDVLQVEEGSLYPALQGMLIKGWVKALWRTRLLLMFFSKSSPVRTGSSGFHTAF